MSIGQRLEERVSSSYRQATRGGAWCYEHLLKRPALGAVLSTEEQREWCKAHGLSEFGLTWYSAAESVGLGALIYFARKAIGVDLSHYVQSGVASVLNASKDTAMYICIGFKVGGITDAVSRMIVEQYLVAKRPRPEILVALGRYVFHECREGITGYLEKHPALDPVKRLYDWRCRRHDARKQRVASELPHHGAQEQPMLHVQKDLASGD